MANPSIRLVQLTHPRHGRRVAVVQEPTLQLVNNISSAYQLALEAIRGKAPIADILSGYLSGEELDYSAIWSGRSEWRLLPSFDHPDNPFACIVSGTGLTHKNSALNRQSMHESATATPTDSLRMYQWGIEGGFPEKGQIGVQPEWFYKGNGHLLRAHNEPLEIPPYGNDGGEEPEVAGIYVVDDKGHPWRIGFSTANEFSDHVMEKKNYLYLAPSKLRTCSIGPELVIGEDFIGLTGTVNILRSGTIAWSSNIHTGEQYMAHSLANLEYHHFKYDLHRVPGQAHVHFFGADAFSFGSKMMLEAEDIMEIHWEGMGRPLRNPLQVEKSGETWIKVKSL